MSEPNHTSAESSDEKSKEAGQPWIGLEMKMLRAVLLGEQHIFQTNLPIWNKYASEFHKALILQHAIERKQYAMLEALVQCCDVCMNQERAFRVAISMDDLKALGLLIDHAKDSTWRHESVYAAAYMENDAALDMLLPTTTHIPEIEKHFEALSQDLDSRTRTYVLAKLAQFKLEANLPASDTTFPLNAKPRL